MIAKIGDVNEMVVKAEFGVGMMASSFRPSLLCHCEDHAQVVGTGIQAKRSVRFSEQDLVR